MKIFVITISMLLVLISCHNRPATTNHPVSSDSAIVTKDSVSKDSQIINVSKQILILIKIKSYEKFAEFIHPVAGIRFSPYGNIDTTKDLKFSKEKFLELINEKNKRKLNWGAYDGSGSSIELSINAYFAKFVYNADYLNAEQTSVNKIIGKGNSTNNIKDIYKYCDFTESYFSGFDKKYDGIDWCSLRLVLKKYNGSFYLVGIVHDQWTI
jgi:hypothetical protein